MKNIRKSKQEKRFSVNAYEGTKIIFRYNQVFKARKEAEDFARECHEYHLNKYGNDYTMEVHEFVVEC